jgi:lipopolysaccharide export system protein LptC
MGNNVTAWFPLALLAALAALTVWLDRAIQPPAPTPNAAARHDPDYIVDNLTAVRMAPDGKIKDTLFAVKMTHYPDDDSTELAQPKFVSHAADRAPVTITAEAALLSSKGEEIHFHRGVHVTRAPYDNKSELQTDYLLVIPDENIARTDRPVRITDANTVVDAVGLELNNETRILKLFSKVKGIYHDSGRSNSAKPR